MQKIDVAINSYKKPESLIYTMLSLKKYCGEYVDTIYINDDQSNDATVKFYLEPKLHKMMHPIKILTRINEKRSGYSKTITTQDMFVHNPVYQLIRFIFDRIRLPQFKGFIYNNNDIRYQWAINSTDKEYLFIIHDDIKFNGNVIKAYLDEMRKRQNCAIVGELGQCNICRESNVCNPELIMNGERPSKHWPLTKSLNHRIIKRYERNCRINEWCCLINVSIARIIGSKKHIYFGNYERWGDVGAYWFDTIVKSGYDFSDPLPSSVIREKFYQHCWQGHSGHSIWAEQEGNKNIYQRDFIVNKIKEEFDYDLMT